MNQMHPAVVILKEKISGKNFQYEDVALHAGMSVHRLKNIMTGRSKMYMEERDALCHVLGITPHEVVILRKDPTFKKMETDLDYLPPKIRKTILKLCKDLREYHEIFRDGESDGALQKGRDKR